MSKVKSKTMPLVEAMGILVTDERFCNGLVRVFEMACDLNHVRLEREKQRLTNSDAQKRRARPQ